MKNKDKQQIKKRLQKIKADVQAVVVGVLEQGANGMEMMHTNRNGDGLSLVERIAEKRKELRKRIEDRDNKKKTEVVKAAVANKKQR